MLQTIVAWIGTAGGFVDGTLVPSVEDQALGLGQVGLLTRGDSSLLFDTFHAAPLFTHRPSER